MRISGPPHGVNVVVWISGPGAGNFAAGLDNTGEAQILRARIYACKPSNSAETRMTAWQWLERSRSRREHSAPLGLVRCTRTRTP